MKRGLATAGLVLILAAGAARAEARDIPAGGLTVEEVASWLQQAGYKGALSKTDDGERYVSSAAEGVNFQVYVYDCKSSSRCASMQFSVVFDLDKGLTADKINEWNLGKRYIKAYIDSEGDPWGQYDVNLSPGRTYEGLDDDFGVWRLTLPVFKSFIGE
jgi:hypothetical protein